MLWPGMARGLPVRPVLAEAGTEQRRADQGRDRTGEVHDGRTGEVRVDGVTDRDLGDQAAAPRPVDDDGVDHRTHDGGERQVGRELRPLRHRARGDRHCGGGEDDLEEEAHGRGEVVGQPAALVQHLGIGTVEEQEVAEATPQVATVARTRSSSRR